MTKTQLIEELDKAKRQIAELQTTDAKRQEAEVFLKESEAKYLSIFNNTTEGIFQTTPQGRVLTANPALADILGYDSPEELVQSINNLGTDLYVLPEKRQEFLDIMKKQGYVRDYEYQAYRKDQSIIDVSINVDIVRDKNNQLLYFEGVLKDITDLKRYREHMGELVRKRTDELSSANKKLQEEIVERKKAESALSESENKYRSIFNNTTEGIFQTTPEGKIITSNPALTRILGYDSPADLMQSIKNLGTDLFVKPERRQEFLEKMKNNGYVRDFEYKAYRKDHRIINATINVDMVRDKNQNFLYFEGVFRDITELKRYQEHMEELIRERTDELISANKKMLREIAERRQTEEALRVSEEKFSKTFHKAPLLMTINEIEKGTYIDVNEKFSEVSGFSREEALGKTSLELGWLSREDTIRLVKTLKNQGVVESMEFSIQGKDNRPISCRYSGEVIDVGGRQVLLSIT